MNQSPLNVQQVQKIYSPKGGKQVHAVKGVSFELSQGEIFGLLGPNGAGKTSTINMITTLEPLDGGSIHVFGKDVVKDPMGVKKSLGVVHQELVTHGFFNLDELLTFHSGYYGIWNNRKQIDFLMENLGLAPHRHKMVKQLSGGMKRRLMIAKALVHQPRMLLLDEPTAGVDVELRNSLWEFVKVLKKQGITILLTTHYLAEAEALCDRVGILNFGELRYLGPTQQVIRKLTKKRVVIQFRNAPELHCESNSYFTRRVSPTELEYALPPEMALGDFFSQLKVDFSQILDVRSREGTLEEAFLSIVSSNGSKPVEVTA